LPMKEGDILDMPRSKKGFRVVVLLGKGEGGSRG
jgi:hypothetical protein